MFIGYHAVDEPIKRRLMKHLRVLERLHDIVVEHEVQPGSHISETVERQLHAADMILLLLTGDFLGSDDHMRQIVEPAIKKNRATESIVVPVIVRSCLWKLTGLAEIDPLPENHEPIEEWQVKESAYRNVATEIRHRIEKLKAALHMRQLEKENEELKKQLLELQEKTLKP